MNAEIRPSKDLRNHYSEISRECHENRKPIIITVNGRGDTVLLGLQEFYQMQAELELLRTLSQAIYSKDRESTSLNSSHP